MNKIYRKMMHLVIFISLASLTACQPRVQGFGGQQPDDSAPVFIDTPAAQGQPTAIIEVPTAAPTLPQSEGQPVESQPAAGGELYITINDMANGTLALGRIPEACLLAESACPAVELVPGFPNTGEYIRPVVWSPDGRFGALALNAMLMVYNPADGNWFAAAQASIPDLPEWSPDSSWIAFIATTNNLRDIYLVRPNGSELHSLTNGAYSGENDYIAGLTWLSDSSLGFWHFPQGQRKEFMQLNLADGSISPLLTMSGLTKDILVYSPDRSRVALESLVDGETQLVLARADGSEQFTAGSYGQSSIWPLTWSPDGAWVAYNMYRSPDMDPFGHVYAAPADGSAEGRELMQGQNVAALVWGPDGRHLVVQAEEGGFSRLFLVDVLDGSVTPLQFDGVSQTAVLQGVSWRIVR